ncbi:hypothetical protein [Bdellovibrio reynosensis]|uniref:DUF1735 domain-containing protein n=1 Tax=Bdellovibrio reynosensis TaxID=2835041 RepID=A0ABY4CBA8_9BACT|nr:hypothetical protein [Bdellovibrio reynosensis]UOF02225.1 hypothetical protein MNR06_04585 [Bdellovibrio reynosensis]
MNFSKASLALLVALTTANCEYSLKRYASEEEAPAGDFILDVDDLVIEDATKAGVSSNEFQLLTNGTTNLGCTEGADGQPTTGFGTVNNSVSLNSFAVYMGETFSFPFTIKPTAVVLRVKRTGNPSANAIVELTDLAAGAPDESDVVATSSTIAMSGFATGSGSDQTFTFATAPTLNASTSYAVVLRGVNGSGTVDGSNTINWRLGNDTSDCSDFDVLQNSSNTGSTWANDATGAVPYFHFVVPAFQATGAGYWIVDGGSSTSWDMASFDIDENPNGDKPGTITYDIGVGADSSTPSYSQTGLSLAQVKALTGLTGRYLYVRVVLNSAYTNMSSSGIGNGAVSEAD